MPRRGFYGTAWCDQVPWRAMGRGAGPGHANQIKQNKYWDGVPGKLRLKEQVQKFVSVDFCVDIQQLLQLKLLAGNLSKQFSF